MRVMAVVYEPCAHPVAGVRVTGFVVEIGDRWVVVGAYPDRPIPLPPGGQIGGSPAAYAFALAPICLHETWEQEEVRELPGNGRADHGPYRL